MLFSAWYLVFDLCLNIFSIWMISINEYFMADGGIYMWGYILCLLPEVILVILFFTYLCSADSPYARKKMVTIMLLGWITALLIILWVIIYIYGIYQYDEVWNGSGPRAKEGEEEKRYTSQPKWEYMLFQLYLGIINLIFYIWQW